MVEQARLVGSRGDVQAIQHSGPITQEYFLEEGPVASQPSGNLLLDFLKEQRIKQRFAPQRKNRTQGSWDKLHHVTFSKDNSVYSSYVREYFDRPRPSQNDPVGPRACQASRQARTEDIPGVVDHFRVDGNLGQSARALPKLPSLQRRFNTTNELFRVPYKDTLWASTTESPRRKWNPRGHVVVSKDNHLVHPGQRAYLDKMLPGWVTTSDSVWRGLSGPREEERPTQSNTGDNSDFQKTERKADRIVRELRPSSYRRAALRTCLMGPYLNGTECAHVNGANSVLKCRARIMPKVWSHEIVEALYSRCHGISDDCRKGCWRHVKAVERNANLDRGGKRLGGKTEDLDNTKSQAEIDRDCCRTCRRCIQYEQELRHKNLHAEVQQEAARRKHGSTVQGGLTDIRAGAFVARRPSYNPHVTSSPIMGSCAAFAALAPAVFSSNPRATQSELLIASAVKLHYVLRGIKRQIGKRRQQLIGVVAPREDKPQAIHSEQEKHVWYVSYAAFCHMLYTSGVSWMTTEQMRGAFKCEGCRRAVMYSHPNGGGDSENSVPTLITPITFVPAIFNERATPEEESLHQQQHRRTMDRGYSQTGRRRSLGEYVYSADGTIVGHDRSTEPPAGIRASTRGSSSKRDSSSRGTTRSSERYHYDGEDIHDSAENDSEAPVVRELMAEYIDKLYHQNWAFAWFLEITHLSGIAQRVYVDRVLKSRSTYEHPYFPRLKLYIDSPSHERMMAWIVIVHCIFLGMQFSTDKTEQNEELLASFTTLEQFFAVFFIFDISLRLLCYGHLYLLYSKWFSAEAVLIVLYALAVWSNSTSKTHDLFRVLQSLRIIRLIRVIRAVRVLPFIRVVWNMVRGLASSARTLFWTYVLIASVLFIFSIFAVEIIARMEVFKGDAAVQEHFGSVSRAMFTLFQVMTLDSWAAIARPMQAKAPGTVTIFFVAVILCVVMVLMNLITAVIVENAFSIAKADAEEQAKIREREKQNDITSLAKLFKELDADGSGELSFDEFHEAVLYNKTVQNKLKVLDLEPDEMEELWTILDVSGDGSLTVEEFSNGLRRVKSAIQSKDLMENVKRVSVLMRKIKIARGKLRNVQKKTIDLEERAAGAHAVVGKVVTKVNRCAQITEACPRWNELLPLEIKRPSEHNEEGRENSDSSSVATE
ncbi:hypothetical protein FOZ60_014651 [Perkinsus olseni]|uniref:EF-hand domain-containing protein n=1 Tax=Perkinsus olseni TaxID=32597 RepID=A0A7J6PMR1_PEROL|nr:hypothetical protein FOZ60_014651 [Perkinsus olseni]